MSQYAALDERIVKAIDDGHNKFHRLEAKAYRLGIGLEAGRLIGHRLQALRKKGRIAFVDGYWQVKKP